MSSTTAFVASSISGNALESALSVTPSATGNTLFNPKALFFLAMLLSPFRQWRRLFLGILGVFLLHLVFLIQFEEPLVRLHRHMQTLTTRPVEQLDIVPPIFQSKTAVGIGENDVRPTIGSLSKGGSLVNDRIEARHVEGGISGVYVREQAPSNILHDILMRRIADAREEDTCHPKMPIRLLRLHH